MANVEDETAPTSDMNRPMFGISTANTTEKDHRLNKVIKKQKNFQ